MHTLDLIVFAIFTAGIVLMGCFFYRRKTSAASWLGLPESGLHEYLAIVLGTTVIFLVGFLALYLFANFAKKSQ